VAGGRRARTGTGLRPDPRLGTDPADFRPDRQSGRRPYDRRAVPGRLRPHATGTPPRTYAAGIHRTAAAALAQDHRSSGERVPATVRSGRSGAAAVRTGVRRAVRPTRRGRCPTGRCGTGWKPRPSAPSASTANCRRYARCPRCRRWSTRRTHAAPGPTAGPPRRPSMVPNSIFDCLHAQMACQSRNIEATLNPSSERPSHTESTGSH
jgi:hypothetical protein